MRELTVTLKRSKPGDKYDYGETLEIAWPDGTIGEWSDGGEPEDNTFGRDWSWVPGAIRQAYEAGKQFARQIDLAARMDAAQGAGAETSDSALAPEVG